MTRLDAALQAIRLGLPIFSLRAAAKHPPPKGWQARATLNPDVAEEWWTARPQRNIGLKMGGNRFGVDVDTRKGGSDTIAQLEVDGREFPRTTRQRTPSGGFHLIYLWPEEAHAATTVGKLGPGIDTRGEGGYLAGWGSTTPEGSYELVDDIEPQPAPLWLVEWSHTRRQQPKAGVELVNPFHASSATLWGRQYLTTSAPLATDGAGGDTCTYAVACHLLDLGVSPEESLELMLAPGGWNDRCSPPWGRDALWTKITHAARYRKNTGAPASPASDFQPVPASPPALTPIQRLNLEYALVTAGGSVHILWFPPGQQRTEHLSVAAFRVKAAPYGKWVGKWLASKDRREYDGIGFHPAGNPPAGVYNTWKGFAVERQMEVDERGHVALAAFLNHIYENICARSVAQFQQFIGFFAHMVQKPEEKPRIALVIKGEKGVGKNAVVGTIGSLLGAHYTLAASRRYLTGNFNSYLENSLLLVLDEAYWAGDHEAEATLKDLVTGETHHIERKGHEPYKIQNYTRVVIIGNAEWVAPATHDERRFLVLLAGNGRKQDTAFFGAMLEGLRQHGGLGLLLEYLSDPAHLVGLDLDTPVKTEGLLGQKHQSLQPLEQWWHASLAEGKLKHADFSDGWPQQLEKEVVRQAIRRYCQEHNIRSRVLSDQEIGQRLKRLCPSLNAALVRKDKGHSPVYRFPQLLAAREEWERHIGHKESWEYVPDQFDAPGASAVDS